MTQIAEQLEKAGVAKKKYNRAMGDRRPVDLLVEKMGVPNAAEAIGLTPSGLSLSLRNDNVTKTTEMAARAVLNEMQVTEAKDRLLILRVPAENEEVVLRFLEALDVRVSDMGVR